MKEPNVKKFKFSEPLVYQISVVGKVDRSWSSRLASMQISPDEELGEENAYVLIGKLKDQAELNGILNTIYDLHLTLASVRTL